MYKRKDLERFLATFVTSSLANTVDPFAFFYLFSKLVSANPGHMDEIISILEALHKQHLLKEELQQNLIFHRHQFLKLKDVLLFLIENPENMEAYDALSEYVLASKPQQNMMLKLSRLNLITPMNLISIIDRVKGEKNLARFSDPLSKLKPVSLELADYFYDMTKYVPLEGRLELYLSYISADQGIGLTDEIMLLLHYSKKPLALIESLVIPGALEIVYADDNLQTLRMLIKGQDMEVLLETLIHLKRYPLDSEVTAIIIPVIAEASADTLYVFNDALLFLFSHTNGPFTEWKFLSDNLDNSLNVAKLFVQLSDHNILVSDIGHYHFLRFVKSNNPFMLEMLAFYKRHDLLSPQFCSYVLTDKVLQWMGNPKLKQLFDYLTFEYITQIVILRQPFLDTERLFDCLGRIATSSHPKNWKNEVLRVGLESPSSNRQRHSLFDFTKLDNEALGTNESPPVAPLISSREHRSKTL